MARPVPASRWPARSRRDRLGRAVGALLAVAALAAGARADLVLHEYVAPDPAEDLRLGATTSDGAMAAAIETRSGPVSLPDVERPSDRKGSVYGSERSPPGSGGTFRADGDTTRPDLVSYDDPFTPALAPYKREFAYDAVNDQLELIVRDPSLAPLAVGGPPRAEDDQFYADLDVDLVEGQAVRIPTVGPGARLLALRSVPDATLQVLHDSADDWFVRANRTGRVRLVLHLAIDRAVFGSPFADVEWPRLWRSLPASEGRAKAEGVRVARQIGVVDGTGPAEALRILVRHFRAFTPSQERLRSTGVDLYRELASSQKGVCRHRAYAFVVTALGLGIPARFVRNEAHAWVEVFDGTRWHRIDLGGAAGRLESSDAGRIAHVPPRDPFAWPSTSDSGQAMAERSRGHGGSGPGGRSAPATDRSATGPSSSPADRRPDPEDQRPRSTVTLGIVGAEARRGSRVAISGRIESPAGPCAEVRVDLFLEPRAGAARDRVPLGTLVTGADGRYEGRVVLPYSVAPGDYDVRATTPGSLQCGEGQSP
jgi:transglutaminase-like putative cysteine protease